MSALNMQNLQKAHRRIRASLPLNVHTIMDTYMPRAVPVYPPKGTVSASCQSADGLLLLPRSVWTGNTSASHRCRRPPQGLSGSRTVSPSGADPRARRPSAGCSRAGNAGGDAHWSLERCCRGAFPTMLSSSR